MFSYQKKKAVDWELTIDGETHNETQVIAAVRREKIIAPPVSDACTSPDSQQYEYADSAFHPSKS